MAMCSLINLERKECSDSFLRQDISVEKVVDKLKARLWSWCSVKIAFNNCFSYNDWLMNPKLILDC